MKKLFFLLFILNTFFLVAQEMPLYLEKLPNNIKYTFLNKTNVFEDATTEIHEFYYNSSNYFLKLSTDGLPDVVIMINNSYEGFELYKKLPDASWIRIIEARSNGKEFGIYTINDKNLSTNIMNLPKDGDNKVEAMLIAYKAYWVLFYNENK